MNTHIMRYYYQITKLETNIIYRKNFLLYSSQNIQISQKVHEELQRLSTIKNKLIFDENLSDIKQKIDESTTNEKN